MSLLVWLPMTKDLSDQGLGGCTITNDGTTIDNNGKLGKCYNFNGTTNRIYVGGFGSPKDISIAFWMKRNANTGTRQFLFTAWNGISIELGTTGNIFGKVSISGGEGGSASGGTITTDSGWVHVCYTFEDKVGGKMYINGELKQATASSASINWAATSMNGYIGNYSNINYSGKMNDFRIYDHVLSPREIEILSRGLVAHYPLNGGGRGGDNLLKNTGDLTLWAKEAGITTTWDSEKNLYKIVDSTHTSNKWGIYQDINIEANTSYTITCTLNGDNCAVAFGFYDSSTSFPGNLITVTDSTTKRLSYTVTSGASSTKARVYLNINCANSSTKTAWFGLPKVEKGNSSTPWMPNPADSAYTAMGYDSTTEYDVSGYGNNGVKNNITYNSNTARYSVCSKFSSSSTRIAFSDIYVGNEWSYGLWVKAPQSTTRTWETVVMLNETGSDSDTQLSFWLNLKANSCQSSANKQYNASIAYPNDGNWHHFFATFDGSNLKTYIDGELVNTKAITNAWFQRTHLTIGANRTGDNTYASYSLCDLSDFRLYATALSATQVAELYNTAVSVSNNGTLMGYELVEG